MNGHFNPRTRVGCDIRELSSSISVNPISIHAPGWGATFGSKQNNFHLWDFNPRTRMGCDLNAEFIGFVQRLFQSTHPHGVRLSDFIPIHWRRDNFNPRTRMGCDCRRRLLPFDAGYFNPRTRMGCDATLLSRYFRRSEFQSTHPHGVRPSAASVILRRSISIHAPAWGATAHRRNSIHAAGYFNPRTRMGCDLDHVRVFRRRRISIHAPAWGATEQQQRGLEREVHFNPRTRVGCDRVFRRFCCSSSYFNPRTRVGCDVSVCSVFNYSFNFNPRTRVGCDQHF